MPHDAAFCESVLQAPVKVLGLALRPFALGHEILLNRQANPLVKLSGLEFGKLPFAEQSRAVQDAALICYRSWKENQQPDRHVRLWRWAVRGFDYQCEIAQFAHYRSSGSSCLPVVNSSVASFLGGEKERGRLLGAPFFSRIYAYLAQLPDREIAPYGSVFDFPFGFGIMLYMTHMEAEGAMKVENEEEMDLRLQFEKLRAEIPPERRVG